MVLLEHLYRMATLGNNIYYRERNIYGSGRLCALSAATRYTIYLRPWLHDPS